MTRDEAIDICLEALKEHEDGSDAWFDVMRDVAELKESKKKKPCEDVVSRKAVLNLAKDLTFKDVEGMEHYKYRCIAVEDVEELPPATPDLSSLREINEALTKRVKYLENMERYAMPPMTPTRKKGKWIKHDTGHSIYYDCSLCGCAAPCTETADKILWKLSNYCPDCGAEMESE